MFKKIVRDTSLLGLGTLISRILGFVRDILVAKFFGTSEVLEAFLVAFRLPNLFRSVFAEGFTDSVATPVLAEHQEDKEKLFEIGNNLLSLFFITLSLVTFLGIIFAKQLIILIAPGFIFNPDKFNLAVSFTRITFFYLLLIGLSSNIVSLLYSLKKFFIPAINPVFLNIPFIVGVLFFGRLFKNYILPVAVLAGGVLELTFPFISLRRKGFILRLNFRHCLKDSQVRRMLKLFGPRVFSSIVYHLNVFVDTILSSLTRLVGEGALAAVYYGNRLIQFPLALIALSISNVATVDLSSYYSQGKMDDFRRLFVFSFQNIIFFTLPVSAIFIFIPAKIIDVLLKRGEFDLFSLKITSSVLLFYSFGLFFFCAIKLLVSAFYSLKDTITPAKTAAFSLVINIVLSAILIFPLKIGGVALGSSLAAMFNFIFLYRHLVKKIGRIEWGDTRAQLIRVIFLSIVLGILSSLLWESFLFNKYLKLLIILGIDFIIFISAGFIFGLKQINYLGSFLNKLIKYT